MAAPSAAAVLATELPGKSAKPSASALTRVYNSQPAPVKAAIIKGALANPTHPASAAVLKLAAPKAPAAKDFGPIPRAPDTTAVPKVAPKAPTILGSEGKAKPLINLPSVEHAVGHAVGTAVHAVGHAVGTAVHAIGHDVGRIQVPSIGQTFHNDLNAQKQLANLTAPRKGGGLIGATAGAGASSGALGNVGQLAAHGAKDLIDLPAEAATSLALPVEKALGGDWAGAANAVFGSYVQAFEYPGGFAKFAFQHPVYAYLMFAGLAHPALRAGEAVGRAALRKGAPDLTAPSVALTGNLTHERSPFSKFPGIRTGQRAVQGQRYERTDSGLLVPKSANVRARQIKIEVSRLVGQAERVRRVNRAIQAVEHAKAVIPGLPKIAAHQLRTTFHYDPAKPLIPGTDVLGLISRGVIRRPDTVAADLQKHIEQVSATRPDLTGFPEQLKAHDKYIKTLEGALANKRFLANPKPAFAAAQKFSQDYPKLEAQAHGLRHFGTMRKLELRRRELMSAVLTHMPNTRWDDGLGTVVRDVPGGRNAPRVEPLSTSEMHRFVHEQTGGRRVTFLSDKGAAGDKAYYVNQQQRPFPETARNTSFNFTHGLTDPTHEALLSQRVRMQGIIDAHRAMNRLDQQLVLPGRDGKFWNSYGEAKKDSPEGYQPIRLARPFHSAESLAQSTSGIDHATLEEEAAVHALDINSRLSSSGGQGVWGVIDSHAAAQLKAHADLISPNTFLRGFRGANNLFRTVALATSFRHLPGVLQEVMIRSAASGVGPISWFAGRASLREAKRLDPTLGHEREIQAGGGTVSGQALSLQTRQVARHFEGTILHGPLAAWEKAVKAPGLRQANGLWHAWARFTLGGTKRMLEEQAQVAGLGKAVIEEFGGGHGLAALALGQWGKMIHNASRGILDESTFRRLQSTVRKIYGRWTDLTPGEQTALMFSPFGMWWANSIGWLARMPIDHPILAAGLASATAGTQKQRQGLGLDMFSPGALPLYKQGSIPVGGSLWQANYYSPFGVANDPLETAQSLIQPWATPVLLASLGDNWIGHSLTSPSNPRGYGQSNAAERIMVILNSLAASFIPLYTKAQTVVTGGAPTYDTSTLLHPQTKGPNPGPVKGVEKAVSPVRLGKANGGRGGAGGLAGVPSLGSLPSLPPLPPLPAIPSG